MTEHSANSESPHDPLSRSALIRAAADGELSAEQSRVLETLRSSDASVDSAIEFESQLRRHVATAMHEPAAAPAALRANIESIFAQERDVVGPAATRSTSFWNRRAGWLAAAAAILVVASATMITQWPVNKQPLPVTGVAPIDQGMFIAASRFIAKEHNRCAPFERYFDLKMKVRDSAEATDTVVKLLGAPPTRIELDDAGYQFAGMGPCAVPGPGASVHMIYRPVDASDGAVSLFVQQSDDSRLLDENVRYRVPMEGGGALLIWRNGGLTYYLFCQDETSQSHLMTLLGAPGRELPA